MSNREARSDSAKLLAAQKETNVLLKIVLLIPVIAAVLCVLVFAYLFLLPLTR